MKAPPQYENALETVLIAAPLSRTGNEPSAGSLREHPAARHLIAVTRDRALIKALRELESQIPIVIVEDLRQFGDAMLRQGGNLALLDSAAVQEPLAGLVDALTTQFPDLRLMVAGQAGEQGMLATRIASETVFRFIHKPATAQRLRVFLQAAAREDGRRQEAAGLEGAPPRRPSKLAFIVAGLAAICVAVGAAWLFWPEGAAARLNARDLAKVEDMMQRAGQALAARRFVSFDGSSGAELYRDVLQLDAMNEQARAGLDNALDRAISSARQALAAGQFDAAMASMEAVREIAPAHRGLAVLVAEVEAETARRLADASAREQMEERQRQIQAALREMSLHLAAGALLEPATGNAITVFQTAQALSPGDAAVRAARNQLTAALVAAGEAALQQNRVGDARQHAAAASRINSSATGLAELLGGIEEAVAVVAPPAVPARNIPTNAEMARTLELLVPATVAPEPEPVAVAPAQPPPPAAPETPAWVPGEGVIPAGQLEVLRRGAADYPSTARVAQITGWVEMEFTVSRNGSVRDIEVTAAEPRRTFDQAAMAAMRDYRFAPVLNEGQPVEQRARLRMRFTLADE